MAQERDFSESQIDFQIIDGDLDQFHVLRYRGTAGLCQLFHFEIEVVSQQDDHDFDKIIGTQAVLHVLAGAGERWFHGVVSRFESVGQDASQAYFRIELVPWVWLLSHRYQSRIFQGKTVPEIIQQVLTDAAMPSDRLKNGLTGTYAPREYCVQYRETDFNFIARLMEAEGIWWSFEHSADKHVLVLADAASAYAPVEGEATLPFQPPTGMNVQTEHVFRFRRAHGVRPGTVTLDDFNFERPDLNLESKHDLGRDAGLEFSDYPGEFIAQARGTSLAKIRGEEFEASRVTAVGQSNSYRLAPGRTFQLTGHPTTSHNDSYLITAMVCQGRQTTARTATAITAQSSLLDPSVSQALVAARQGDNAPLRALAEGLLQLAGGLALADPTAQRTVSAWLYHAGQVVRDAATSAQALIRLPGGYCFNEPNKAGPYDDPNFKYELTADRHELEHDLLKHNDLMHKIPLVAKVHRIKPDGKREPAEGVSVYFQLVKPDEWPEDAAATAQKKAANDRASAAATALANNKDVSKTGALTTEKEEADKAALAANNAPPPKPSHPLRAPNLRDTEMDFGKDSAPGKDAGPYLIKDAGPERFVDDVIKANPSPDTEDPQADNAPFKFGGKRDHPVAGEKVSGTLVPGIFEVDTKRDGLHSKRDDKHADYGDLFAAKKVEPTTETVSGKPVKRHNYAVRAVTNDKGNAGVIFMPARCGGDRYKLRAYVGPTTLGFAGEEPGGPVVTTGTMVVWRNIRLYRYIQFPVPAKASVDAEVKKICDYDKNSETFDDYWDKNGFASGTPPVDLSNAGNGETIYQKTTYFQSDGSTLNDNYRPVDVVFTGLVEQYRRCWCELIIEQPSRSSHVLSPSELQGAVAAARKAAADSGVVGKTIDWEVLVLKQANAEGV